MDVNAFNKQLRELSNLIPQIAGSLVTIIAIIAAIVGLVAGGQESTTGSSSDRANGIISQPEQAENLAPENLLFTSFMAATNSTKSGGKNYANSVETTPGYDGFIRIKNPETVKRLVLKAGYPDGRGKGKRGTVTIRGGSIDRTYDVRPGEITVVDVRFDRAGLITVNASVDVALLSPVVYR